MESDVVRQTERIRPPEPTRLKMVREKRDPPSRERQPPPDTRREPPESVEDEEAHQVDVVV